MKALLRLTSISLRRRMPYELIVDSGVPSPERGSPRGNSENPTRLAHPHGAFLRSGIGATSAAQMRCKACYYKDVMTNIMILERPFHQDRRLIASL
jgi:hypothetical protein